MAESGGGIRLAPDEARGGVDARGSTCRQVGGQEDNTSPPRRLRMSPRHVAGIEIHAADEARGCDGASTPAVEPDGGDLNPRLTSPQDARAPAPSADPHAVSFERCPATNAITPYTLRRRKARRNGAEQTQQPGPKFRGRDVLRQKRVQCGKTHRPRAIVRGPSAGSMDQARSDPSPFSATKSVAPL